jgi:hypothetical protein
VGASDRIPIAIGLSNKYRNIGLTYLSDLNYWTSNIGLPIVRKLYDLLKLYRTKNGEFLLFLACFFAEEHYAPLKITRRKSDSESTRDPTIVHIVVYIFLSSSVNCCAAINIHLFIYLIF